MFFPIFVSQYHKHVILTPIINYETIKNTIKICKKILKPIKYDYLKMNIFLNYKIIIKYDYF